MKYEITQKTSKDQANDCNSDSTEDPKIKATRKRKTNNQMEILVAAFNSSPHWRGKLVKELVKRTGLSQGQVYKWGWDYKKKRRLAGQQVENRSLECQEFLYPSQIDQGLWETGNLYRNTVSEYCFGIYD